MKVVSRFNDYYDSLRSIDQDPEPLYVRETREHRFGWRRTGETREDRAIRDACDALWTNEIVPPVPPEEWRRGVVAFCGRAFAFVRNIDTGDVRYTFAHFIDDGGVDRYDRRQWAHFERTRTRTIGDAPFRFFDAPALLMTDESVIVNPRLKDVAFASQVDPYTAWQDLSVFLGNNLVKNVSTPKPVSDELKRDAHGFDKQSFKKAKTARKKLDRGEW